MKEHSVIIYTSTNSLSCGKLLEKMNEWEIDYAEKNVSKNQVYLTELQERGIFGTPATFIDDEPILGFQEASLRYKLGLSNNPDFLN